MKNFKNLIGVSISAMFLAACGGGGSSSSPTTPVAKTPAPTVQITLSAPKVYVGEKVTINWTSTNATTCSGVEGFLGIQAINGTLNFTPTVGGQFKYTLNCTGEGGSFSQTQTVIAENEIQTFSGQQSQTNITSSTVHGNYNPTAGSFVFNTGIWGLMAANSYTFGINGSVNIKNSTVTTVEFTWDAVTSSTPGIVAYNNVTFGKHPGWDKSTSTKFPVQTGTMPSIKVTGDVKTVCLTTCVYGTILNLFVTAMPNPTYADVGTEFLIVTENSEGGINPNAPGYVGKAVVNGIEFNVYYNGFKSTWNNIGYSPIKQSSLVNIDLRDFMLDAINRGYIKSSDYLMGVEAGTEIVFGKGKTTITNLTIN